MSCKRQNQAGPVGAGRRGVAGVPGPTGPTGPASGSGGGGAIRSTFFATLEGTAQIGTTEVNVLELPITLPADTSGKIDIFFSASFGGLGGVEVDAEWFVRVGPAGNPLGATLELGSRASTNANAATAGACASGIIRVTNLAPGPQVIYLNAKTSSLATTGPKQLMAVSIYAQEIA